MFRIHFQPRGGFWCVQFERFGLFWETVQVSVSVEGSKPRLEPLKFDTYEAADTYVVEKGIDQIYRCRSGEPPALQLSATHTPVTQEFPLRNRPRAVRRVPYEKVEAQVS